MDRTIYPIDPEEAAAIEAEINGHTGGGDHDAETVPVARAQTDTSAPGPTPKRRGTRKKAAAATPSEESPVPPADSLDAVTAVLGEEIAAAKAKEVEHRQKVEDAAAAKARAKAEREEKRVAAKAAKENKPKRQPREAQPDEKITGYSPAHLFHAGNPVLIAALKKLRTIGASARAVYATHGRESEEGRVAFQDQADCRAAYKALCARHGAKAGY